MSEELDRLERLARAATPGPWEQGDVWGWAGVMPERFGDGRCTLCERNGEPVWTGKTDINGTRMLAHRHRQVDPWGTDHLISAEDSVVAGNYDYDAGGIVRVEDCAYITAVSPDVVLGLIERVRALEGALNQSAHVIVFDGKGSWSIEHLVGCRPIMSECEYHQAAMRLAPEWVEQYRGRYAVDLTPDGELSVGERLDSPA